MLSWWHHPHVCWRRAGARISRIANHISYSKPTTALMDRRKRPSPGLLDLIESHEVMNCDTEVRQSTESSCRAAGPRISHEVEESGNSATRATGMWRRFSPTLQWSRPRDEILLSLLLLHIDRAIEEVLRTRQVRPEQNCKYPLLQSLSRTQPLRLTLNTFWSRLAPRGNP